MFIHNGFYLRCNLRWTSRPRPSTDVTRLIEFLKKLCDPNTDCLQIFQTQKTANRWCFMTSQGMVQNSLKLVRAVDHRCSFFLFSHVEVCGYAYTLISGKTIIIVLSPRSTLIFRIYDYTRIYATVSRTVNIVSCNDRTTITKCKLFFDYYCTLQQYTFSGALALAEVYLHVCVSTIIFIHYHLRCQHPSPPLTTRLKYKN